MAILWLGFLCSGTLLLVFSLAFFTAFLFYKPKSPAIDKEAEGVSLLICANNELENLKKNLPLFVNQNHSKFELIVVDDKSTDGTYEFLHEQEKIVPNLKLVRIDHTPDHINGKKYAITLGIRGAANDIILLSDADCWPKSAEWISSMTAPFQTKGIEIVIGYSQYSYFKGFLNRFIQYETLLSGLNYLSFALFKKPYMGVGRNLAYRKSLFLRANGFSKHQKIVGGDDDLFVKENANSKNTAVQIGKDAMIYSTPKKTLRSYLVQKRRHLSVGKKYKMSDKIILGSIFFAKMVCWVSFISVIMAGYKLNEALIGFLIISFTHLAAILLLKTKAGDDSKLWLSPFLDIAYIFYYISTGLAVLFTKRIKWS